MNSITPPDGAAIRCAHCTNGLSPVFLNLCDYDRHRANVHGHTVTPRSDCLPDNAASAPQGNRPPWGAHHLDHATAASANNPPAGRDILTEPIMAVAAGTNADLVANCIRLGYIGGHILDCTYGLGGFWNNVDQTLLSDVQLTASDIDQKRSPIGRSIDYTNMPWEDNTFDTVVFDPPYKLNGTGGSHPSDERYGVAVLYRSHDDVMADILAGVTECVRVLRKGGHLLVKCQDQVSGGKVRWQTFRIWDYVTGCMVDSWPSIEMVDMFHLLSYRPQPGGRRQVHARRNYSTLMVFKRLT